MAWATRHLLFILKLRHPRSGRLWRRLKLRFYQLHYELVTSIKYVAIYREYIKQIRLSIKRRELLFLLEKFLGMRNHRRKSFDAMSVEKWVPCNMTEGSWRGDNKLKYKIKPKPCRQNSIFSLVSSYEVQGASKTPRCACRHRQNC